MSLWTLLVKTQKATLLTTPRHATDMQQILLGPPFFYLHGGAVVHQAQSDMLQN